MAIATITGYPRIGRKRELKRALEAYWAGKQSERELLSTAAELRKAAWNVQREAGLDLLPVNDFSLYDQVLDTIALTGAVPSRYGWNGGDVGLETYFAMARGTNSGPEVHALDMTKWFDTNYHYIVPEFEPDQTFRLASNKPFEQLAEAIQTGVPAKVTLVGPLTFLLLGKTEHDSFSPLEKLLDRLLPVYSEVIAKLAEGGAEWIQLDEPVLVEDRTPPELEALTHAYGELSKAKGNSRLLVQTYFGHVGESYDPLVELPVDGIGLDYVRGQHNLSLLSERGFPEDKWLVAGVVDGRNIWVNDLESSIETLDNITRYVSPDRLMVSTSCSLQHVPYDKTIEPDLPGDLALWLAFAEQKLQEVAVLTRSVNEDADAVRDAIERNREVIRSHTESSQRHNREVQARMAALTEADARRASSFAERSIIQSQTFQLPPLPTTTIGSFPQTGEVRAVRHRFERGEITQEQYDSFIEHQISDLVDLQEQLGLDVFVHGEFERNDMVQYFGEQLEGFAFTRFGWVQSYGSRCVRPPIIFGDVSRPHPMTVRWAQFTQSLTNHPVKGMLTGPVTILNWSFVRDDQPRSVTCKQIALALRDEVKDLDQAGIRVIQIDEPALREGLPLRHSEWEEYLRWAVESFRIASSAVQDQTQIHTHMCYSEFEDIIGAISDLDADVLFIENARSDLEMLEVFRKYGYDKGVGPGVYDVHSPRVPSVEEILDNLRATMTVLDARQVWVNPDCGLKTRGQEETNASLANLVAAARKLREEMAEVAVS